jgi:soluble lytic murein transglycosylase-like protein
MVEPKTRLRRAVLVTLICPVLAAGCTGGERAGAPPASNAPPASSRATPPLASTGVPETPSPSPPASPSHRADLVPAPDRPIPEKPRALAGTLVTTNRDLLDAIGRWVGAAGPSPARPPSTVVLLALYQQRIYRLLARDETLARRTLELLPAGVAAAAAANVGAGRDLFSLVNRVSRRFVLHVQRPEPPGGLFAYFHEAERRFGVDWELLAAVMLVESKFGRTRSASTAGAQGPMQFIPSTWDAYGLGGDIQDPHDAILGAANNLHASGAPGDERRALFAYNHARAYVDAVEAYADQMRADPLAYFVYYNWQVFVATKAGDRRLTGPGVS